MNRNEGKLKWSSLIIGTILLIVAIIIFSYPVKNFYALTWLIGLLIIINGFLQLFFRRVTKMASGGNGTFVVILGIIDIIFGLLVVFNVGTSSAFFIYMFAAWFIISSIISLMNITGQNRMRGLTILTSILRIIMGIILLFNPMMGMIVVSMMIAIMFVILGITYVIDGLS